MGLAAQLQSLDDQRLAALLVARRDLLEQPPRNFEQLANRAAAYRSQLACVAGLDLFLHQLLELASVAGSPATLEGVARLAGPNVGADELTSGFRRLHDLGLVAFAPPSVRLIGDLAGRLGVPGLGRLVRRLLPGRTVEELRRILAGLRIRIPVASPRKADMLAAIADHLEDPRHLGRLLADAPPEVGRLLDSLDRQRSATLVSYSAFAYRRGTATDPVERAAAWLIERGLLVQTTWGAGELIGEVGLLRRGGVPFPDISARPPPLSPAPVVQSVADDTAPAEAGAAAGRVVELLARLGHLLAAEPAPLLKAGGLGVRPLRRLAEGLGLDEHDAATLVEVAAAAGLVASGRGAVLEPGGLFDGWSELDAVDRWLHVVRSWLVARSYLRAAGEPTDEGRPVAPLSGGTGSFDVVRQRRDLLEVLAALPDGRLVERDTLVAHLVWRTPHLWLSAPADPDTTVTWLLEEAALLGVARGAGGLASAVQRELAGDGEGAREAAVRTFPAQESSFIVQADLTVLAMGALEPRIAGELGRFAEVESRGGATVYRLSPASVGRALQGGQRSEQIIGVLEAHSRSGVPQPVRVLVEDAGRRYGRLRVGGAASFLRCDDPALLAELVRHRKLAKLGLRELAPTVAVSSAAAEVVVSAVSAAGYLPAEEGEDGGLVVRRPSAPAGAGRGRGLLAGPGRSPSPAAPALDSRGRSAPSIDAVLGLLRGTAPLLPPSGPPVPDGVSQAALALPGLTWGSGQGDPAFEDDESAEFTIDPARYRAILQLAWDEGLTVSVGVQEDDGAVVDLVGTPLALHDGVVALRCADCSDVHELSFEEIDWIELLDEWDDELAPVSTRAVAPSSPTIGSGRTRSRTTRRAR